MKVDFEKFLNAESQEVFAPRVMSFLDALAKDILSDKESRRFPDVIAFGLWCRNLNLEKSENERNSHRKGRGVIFHITPGNVPINFAYSLVSGLLSGNKNIIKLPSKMFEQVEFLILKFNSIVDKKSHEDVTGKFILIRYPRDKSINDYFSSVCDVRVIWGGDQSINEIRQSQIPAKSYDVTFADRFSICVINSKEYVNSKDYIKIAQGFYNDTYLFDQNACTAPHLIIWIGTKSEAETASEIFWDNLQTLTTKRYSIEPLQIMDKLVASTRFSADNQSVRLIRNADSKIFRIELDSIPPRLEYFKSHSGFFFEITLQELDNLLESITNNYQTLTYFGFDQVVLNNFANSSRLRGIDRIVPIGKSLDFSFVWDGRNLIEALSRKVEIIPS